MTAHELVAKARNLPRISQAALKLVDLLDPLEHSTHEAVDLIKSDTVLTAKLLRACNSSTMGLVDKVSSIDHALLLLGYHQTLSLALTLTVGGAMTGALPCYSIGENGLWRHAFAAAVAAEAVVQRRLFEDDASMAFTAGLLHDIGKLVIVQALSPETQAIIQKHVADEGLHVAEAEREVLGTDHAEVGACLLHVWRLPDAIVEAVANHHRPVFDPTPRLSGVTHIANRIAHRTIDEPSNPAYAFQDEEPVVEIFGLTIDEQTHIANAIRNHTTRAHNLLALV
ncbi:MAG: HDOD domain-containing protein [Verrucomicrobiota bacterium]